MLALALSACIVSSETEPNALGPTETFSTAVPATEEPTQTAEPPPPTQTVEPTPEPTAEPTEEPTTVEIEPLDLCVEFPRPAMLVMYPDEQYALFNPESGESCPLPLLKPVPGMVVMAQNDFFAATPTIGGQGNVTIILHYREDILDFDELPYTVVVSEIGDSLTAFTVSADARLIAWATIESGGETGFPSPRLYIADLESGQQLNSVTPEANEAPRAFQPIRFSDDGSILYYALQPYGIGGRWTSFNGRYDNLYALPTAGTGDPELIFDCGELGFGLCLGDFTVLDNVVTSVAYVNQQANAIVVQNNSGDVLNTFEGEGDYIGYPTFSASGEFIYYTADITEDPDAINPATMGRLHRSAPVIFPAETLVADPNLLLPLRFFDDSHIIVQWFAEDGSNGLALIGMDGAIQHLDLPPNATVLPN